MQEAPAALLVVTADRAHDVLPSIAADAPVIANPKPQTLTQNAAAAAGRTAPPRRNALEEAFGAPPPQRVGGAAGNAGSSAQPGPTVQGARPADVAARLFDRPSHLLRPTPDLAREFLMGLSRPAAAAGG